MTSEIEKIKTQISMNGSAFLHAPRRAGETKEQAVRRLHRRLMNQRTLHGLVKWRFHCMASGVLVTVGKDAADPARKTGSALGGEFICKQVYHISTIQSPDSGMKSETVVSKSNSICKYLWVVRMLACPSNRLICVMGMPAW